PGALSDRAAGLVFPGLGLVEARGGHEVDPAALAQLLHGGAQHRDAIADVRAEAEVDALHHRLRVSSTPGVPTTPSRGAVIFRTRTHTSRVGNSRSMASAMSPASRSIRLTRGPVPISTTRFATAP